MRRKQYDNIIGTVAFLLALIGFISFFYDFYYDLNDDVLMKDILAGVYTGQPESRNIQMLYGISALISLFYRLIPALPWYGIFLCVCQFGSIGLIVYRSLTLCKSRVLKGIIVVLSGLLSLGMLLYHLVFVQYTITCTMLAAAAAFLFYTSDSTLAPKDFLKKNVLPVLLVWLAYLIRSEMLLLVLPMICVAGVCKWGNEPRIFIKDNVIKYGSVIGAILLGLLAGEATHRIAHSSPEWQSFTEYFDNRTELYDFQTIPEYEGNEAFYDSIGLTRWERELLDNYNFGLSEEINEDTLLAIADYAAAGKSEETSLEQEFFKKLRTYCYHLLHVVNRSTAEENSGLPFQWGQEYPFNILVLTLYVGIAVISVAGSWRYYRDQGSFQQHKAKALICTCLRGIWQPAFLFIVRTALWMFIIMRDRQPLRITHSLYFMEFCILVGMLAMALVKAPGKGLTSRAGAIAGILICLEVICFFPAGFGSVNYEFRYRDEVNRPYQAMQAYCRQEDNQGNYYFVDVYSTVAFSEKMFKDVDNRLANHDIMGGWACKSPLYYKKLSAFDITTMEAALLERNHVYLIAEPENDLRWLRGYYAEQNVTIDIVQIDEIAGGMQVYRIRGQ